MLRLVSLSLGALRSVFIQPSVEERKKKLEPYLKDAPDAIRKLVYERLTRQATGDEDRVIADYFLPKGSKNLRPLRFVQAQLFDHHTGGG
jgi:hypothetical protein